MRKFLFDKILSNRTMPNWVILLFDLSIVAFATFLAVLFRINFKTPAKFYDIDLVIIFGTILAVRCILYVIFRPFTRLLRYTGTRDVILFFWLNLLGSAIFGLLNILRFILFDGKYAVPFSVVLLEFIVSTFIIIFYRLFIRSIYSEYSTSTRRTYNVLIFGAGFFGVTTERSISREANGKYKVVGFIDEDSQKIGKRIGGLTIYGIDDLPHIIEEKEVNFVIIAINDITTEKRNIVKWQAPLFDTDENLPSDV